MGYFFCKYFAHVQNINNFAHVQNTNLHAMNLKEVKKLLPSNGLKVIAERSQVSYAEITRMFNGLETKKTTIVVQTTANYLAELEVQRKEIAKSLNRII